MMREEAIRWLEETIQDTDAYWNSCSEALQRCNKGMEQQVVALRKGQEE